MHAPRLSKRSKRIAAHILALAFWCGAIASKQALGAESAVALWPKEAPGEKGDIGDEHDTTDASGGLVAGQRVIRLGNVSRPTLTLYRPPRDKDTGTAVVVCPGGGYSILAMDLEGTEVCEWLNSIGVTGVLLKYRVPARKGQERYLAPLQDSQRALSVVRAHAADWGLDAKRVGILGFSAGGHLSAAASTRFEQRAYEAVDDADKQSCRPDFAVVIYPGYLAVKEQGDKLAPELTVTTQTPPTFLVQTEDDGVRVENSLTYYAALKSAHVPVEMHLFAQGGHGYGLRPTDKAVTGWPTLAAQWMQGLGLLAAPSKYWAVEDPKERERLPLYQTLPAAAPTELTPANGFPKRETYLGWHRSHGDNGGTRYSALDQINRTNVGSLGVAWTYHSKDGMNNIQCNPIIVGKLMFAPTPGHHMVAVDAVTGEERWRFKPEGRPAFRGLIWWPGRAGAADRLMFCAGPYLYALNPQTGQLIADFGEGGKVVLPGRTQGDFGAATAAPTTFENIIVVAGFEKDVWGFDCVNGKHLWTFHTVPQPGEFGAETWDRQEAYAANAWAGAAMDEVRGIAYIVTGSPKPNFTGVWHRGDNLFANCVIALDARTGKRLWHFQEIRHDIWDLDITSPPNLTTILRDGKRVDVVAVCTKIGNTLLLDRVTGKPIFPFRLRRAPTSEVPGEVTAPYQPDPELPERFSKMEFTADDLFNRTEESYDYVQTQFKSALTGWFRPVSEGKTVLYLGIDGGAEWTGACVDPDTGYLYVTANHVGWNISLFRDGDPPHDYRAPKTHGQLVFEATCAQCHGTNLMGIGTAPPLRGLRFRHDESYVTNQVRTGKNAMPANKDLSDADLKAIADYLLWKDRPVPPMPEHPERPSYNVTGYPKFYDQDGYPANKPPWGTLNCLDLNTGKLLWKVPHGEYPQLAAKGMKGTGTENYGGPIVTAGGLVFCAGTRDNKIRAYDKSTGKELWSSQLPWTGSAPPACYEVDGRQFIVIASTGGNKLGTPYGDAYVAFALPK